MLNYIVQSIINDKHFVEHMNYKEQITIGVFCDSKTNKIIKYIRDVTDDDKYSRIKLSLDDEKYKVYFYDVSIKITDDCNMINISHDHNIQSLKKLKNIFNQDLMSDNITFMMGMIYMMNQTNHKPKTFLN